VDIYLDKAIPQMVARARHALDSVPPRLTSELTVLAQRCSTELDEVLGKLERLANDPRLCEPQNREERLRAFQRVVRDLEYIQNVGLAALERDSEPDQRLNHLLQHIMQEIAYPLPLPTISRDYFYVHTRFNFNLVCVPPGEKGSLLHLSDLYHELAHPLLREKHISRVQSFIQALKKIRDLVLAHFYSELQAQEQQRGPDVFKIYLERWMQSWFRFWSVEFLCDLFAIYTVGPAFAWAHLHLCAKRTDDPFEFKETLGESHPADDARMQLMLFALDRIGFADDANLIEARWQELVVSLATEKGPEYRRCYPRKLIMAVEEIAFQGVVAMDCNLASPKAPGHVRGMLNKAWYEFWQEWPSVGDWDKEQTERLYQYCETTPVRGVSKVVFQGEDKVGEKMPKRKRAQAKPRRFQSLVEAEATFENAAAELLAEISSNEALRKEYPSLVTDDLLKLRLEMKDPPRGGIYDHVVFERKFYLSTKLILAFKNYWERNRIGEKDRRRVCKLFLLHELLHVSQHVDSNTYIYSKNSKSSFRFIDYDADAFAVKTCFLLEGRSSTWNYDLADILAAHIRGGEVFSAADDGRGNNNIEGGRLHRQVVWHIQYARARGFRPEAGLDEFDIGRQLMVEIFSVTESGGRENLCEMVAVTPKNLAGVVEIHVVWGGRRFRYHMTNKHYTESFIKGIFESDLGCTAEAFRPFFDDNPELLGRSAGMRSEEFHGRPVNLNQEILSVDRIVFIQKLYGLHHDDLGKLLSAIPHAGQKVSPDNTFSKRIEQLISWSESGTGPGLEKVYDAARKLFPSYF